LNPLILAPVHKTWNPVQETSHTDSCALITLNLPSGIAKLQESLVVALDHNLHVHAGRSYANLVSMAVDYHLGTVASRFIPEGSEYCEVHEVHDCLSYIRAYAAHFELNAGRWNEAAGPTRTSGGCWQTRRLAHWAGGLLGSPCRSDSAGAVRYC
jgi:hypothetical protein